LREDQSKITALPALIEA